MYHTLTNTLILPKSVATRSASTDQDKTKVNTDEVKLTTRQKLQKAVTEYGSTVIIFHVGISLISLGTCYLLVSRYLLTILTNFCEKNNAFPYDNN